ncbi:MAG: DUF2946 family protein [Rubrivivax sp.]|nr:DUF2946 family protein [Rubrivivax sp.]
MNALRHRRRPIAWLALWALLAMALLPSLAQAFAPAGGKTVWSEVCTPQGMRLVAIDAVSGDAPAPVSTAGHLAHCPYCMTGDGGFGLPAMMAAHHPVAAAAAPLTVVTRGAAAPPLWSPAQPRGPPVGA